MGTKTQNTENKNLKKLEEAELTVTLFDKDDVVATSGCTSGCATLGTNSCIAKGTEITMLGGTVKSIENIREGDLIMVFNHEAGCFVGSEVLYAYKGDAPKCAFTVRFANGAELSMVGEHDLFEQESRKYVTLTEENAEQFIGRHFYSAAEKAYVELMSVTHETEAVDYYEIYTKNSLNCIANGMLNVADDVDSLLNIYELSENLKADANALANDIQKYGIFEYSAKLGFSKEEYDAWNLRYLNITVGKDLITWEKIWGQHFGYVAQCFRREKNECA